jgi:hypothetical protein
MREPHYDKVCFHLETSSPPAIFSTKGLQPPWRQFVLSHSTNQEQKAQKGLDVQYVKKGVAFCIFNELKPDFQQ